MEKKFHYAATAGRLGMGKEAIATRLCPGHTPGCTAFFFEDTDEVTGKTYKVALHGGLGVGRMDSQGMIDSGYPVEMAYQFVQDCQELAKMPVDICLASHLNQCNILPNVPRENPDDYTVFVADYAWGDMLLDRAAAVMSFYPEVYGEDVGKDAIICRPESEA